MHGCALLLHLCLQAGHLLLLAVELQLRLQPRLLLSLPQQPAAASLIPHTPPRHSLLLRHTPVCSNSHAPKQAADTHRQPGYAHSLGTRVSVSMSCCIPAVQHSGPACP